MYSNVVMLFWGVLAFFGVYMESAALMFVAYMVNIDGERTTIFSQDQTSTNKEPQTTMIATEPGDEYYDDDESTGTQTSAVPEDEATEESPEGTSTEEKSDTTVTTDEGMISTTLLPETMEENAGAETENATGMEGTLSTTALSEATETTNPQVTKALEDEGEETTATDEVNCCASLRYCSYIRLMRQQCPRTCGFCSNRRRPVESDAERDSECRDRVINRKGRSVCRRQQRLCKVAAYQKLMKELCPLTCGFCSPNVKSASTELEGENSQVLLTVYLGECGLIPDCADSRVSTACNLRRMVCRHSNTPLTIRRQMEAQCAVTCGVCSKMR
ncbi:unnamed protein product [Nippostrongylus brasiliensis]|uniref:ShKT domain-containing protein n=1 Tax=Nippostrongylus brasiliensis TaxID=27835 RepID=A0A0N4YHJ8_NIPBR|nr:unnamed protein product [Nippostrongylus brasiliensis]